MSDELPPFTPVIDIIVDELGWSAAFIFGIIWRYSQMKDGCCWASQHTIGNRANLTRYTANRKIKELIEHEYLEDLTPEASGITHKYIPTRKIYNYQRHPPGVEPTCGSNSQQLSTKTTGTCKLGLHKDMIKEKKKIDDTSDFLSQSENHAGVEKLTEEILNRVHSLPPILQEIIELVIEKWQIKPNIKIWNDWFRGLHGIYLLTFSHNLTPKELIDILFKEYKKNPFQVYSPVEIFNFGCAHNDFFIKE